jgi:3-phosphoshikimate 1-carboxyvinyltransferase
LQSKEGSFVKVHGGGVGGGKTTIRGDVSSQFISGLMFACPMAREDTEIILATPLESKTYVQMTKEILNKHGIRVFISDNFEQLQIHSNQTYRQCNHEVPGDFSSAAFLLATAAITSSKVQVKNLDYRTNQGDKAIVNILAKMGLNVKLNDDTVEVEGEGKPFNAVDVDAKDMPDLVPVCAVLACYSRGTSMIHNAQRLKYKESDRLRTLYVELRKMGADITINEDVLIIKGPCAMHGNTINAHNDHRIVMACAVAALGANGETRIRNSGSVKKSYPSFFKDLRSLGADIIDG